MVAGRWSFTGGELVAWTFDEPEDPGGSEGVLLVARLRAAASRRRPPLDLSPPPSLHSPSSTPLRSYANATTGSAPQPPDIDHQHDHDSDYDFIRHYHDAIHEVMSEVRDSEWESGVPSPGPLSRALDAYRAEEGEAVPAGLVCVLSPGLGEREATAVWVAAHLPPLGWLAETHLAVEVGAWVPKMAALLENPEESRSLPPDPDIRLPVRENMFRVGRSQLGGQVVLGLARVNGESRAIAIRQVPCSDTADFCIRRLKDFTRFLEPHLHLLNYQRFLLHEGRWYLGRDVVDDNLDSFLERLRGSGASESEVEAAVRPLFFHLNRGLAFLHGKTPALFHGNLKPSNLLIDARGVLRLTDFGFGKLCTLRHQYCGPAWVAEEGGGPRALHPLAWKPPEFYSVEKSYNGASDVHAAGMLGVYMLSVGQVHPFLPETATAGGLLRATELADRLNRDSPRLTSLSAEARDLVSAMVRVAQSGRISARLVLAHPFFWPTDRKAGFLLAVAAAGGPHLLRNHSLNCGDWRSRVRAGLEAAGLPLPDSASLGALLTLIRTAFASPNDSPLAHPAFYIQALPDFFVRVYGAVLDSELADHPSIAPFLEPDS